MNSFGRRFRITIFGESHGQSLGFVIDGCPAGIPLTVDDFKEDLSRRKPGAKGTTTRKEPDEPVLQSGVFENCTTGAPIAILFKNTNVRSKDYAKIKDIPRPGHADFVAFKKFAGYNDYRGGGHFSGRLTLALVAAGIVAKKIIEPIKVSATVAEVGGEKDVEKAIAKAIQSGDSIGGIVVCQATPMPVGLGEPFFDSAESLISHMIFSIPAVRAIEFGAGFRAARMHGSEHNDPIISTDGVTKTNNAGGINGGITNGNDLFLRVAIKPTPTIAKPQSTINMKTGKMTDLVVEGRHDTCIALRVPVVIESAVAIILADLLLMDQQRHRVRMR